MWHAVAPVSSEYDPIVYEGPEPAQVVVLNAGPGIVLAKAWPNITPHEDAAVQIELRPGDSRVISGLLVRIRLKTGTINFAAIGWRVLSHGVGVFFDRE